MFGLVGLFGLQVGDFFFHFSFFGIISLVFGAVVVFFGMYVECNDRKYNKNKIMKINAHKDTLN